MLVSAAPVAIPVSTANPPTESVASEAAQKTPIPEPAATADNPATRNSTDSADQNKPSVYSNVQSQSKETKEESSGENSQETPQDEKQRELPQEDLKEVAQLKQVDREVRAHETAHASAGGQLTGAPQLSFVTGPDGKRYAVAGEVSIDTAKVPDNAQATLSKMNQVRQAALAPADPSAQDLKVAAMASQIANQAVIEINLERQQTLSQSGSADAPTGDADVGENKPNQQNIRFTNPVSARRSALQLNQRIVDSGALDDVNRQSLVSSSA